ncbi:VanZ family protein [Lysobacter sp. TAF61]|uniref:VanZ family protein n=1 Tax=Lysobacter sp. TAF61 TaxID=3233072 RepID=UPI003F9E7CFC
MTPLLRELRWPRLWLGLWLLMIAAVIVTSLVAASDLPPPAFDGIDKFEHFFSYLILSAYGVMLIERRRPQALMAAGLIALGVGLEIAQGALTTSRQADSADALANSLGVLAGLILAATPVSRGLQWLEARFR